ncbi:hypothetical protein, partial [Selenomonas sp.]|uniref:hypothetical protein n=1 Tax=Selenomonas sp. TaxID=2053611 RepID=UPI002A7656B1
MFKPIGSNIVLSFPLNNFSCQKPCFFSGRVHIVSLVGCTHISFFLGHAAYASDSVSATGIGIMASAVTRCAR